MSFAYKRINNNDISINEYRANKQFNINESELSGSGISLFFGENIPINDNNLFDPINDNRTTNNEYNKLIFNSVKHLFYKNFNDSGEFITSSSLEYYPQTTLYSGSFTTTLRHLDNITGSSFINNIIGYNNTEYNISSSIYDNSIFDSGNGNALLLLSVDKQLFGKNLKPNTFIIDNDFGYIRDDGEGNLFNFINIQNYNDYLNNGTLFEYIGNIIYSFGLVIVTNPNYLCILNSPPTAINDYYIFNNLNPPSNFDIISNDFTLCGSIDFSTIDLIPLDSPFPDVYIGGDSFLYLIPNQNSFIPGNYQIGYIVKNNTGLESNLGYINFNITSKDLEINNLNYTKTCNDIPTSIDISFDINEGVPEYSWSTDNITYTPISGFNNISISESVSPFETLYVKDYIGNIVSSSINPYYEIDYLIISSSNGLCDNSGSIYISSSNGIYFTIEGDVTEYNTNENINIELGEYNFNLYNEYSCSISSSFNLSLPNPITFDLYTSSVICNGESNGIINISNIQGGVPPYSTSLSTMFSVSFELINENLQANTYLLGISDNNGCSTSSYIEITQPEELTLSSSISYNVENYSILNLFPSGGTPPYSYIIITPNTLYNSDSSSIDLYNEGLNGYFLTASITDFNNCQYITYQEVYGRQYIYSGSYCEQE